MASLRLRGINYDTGTRYVGGVSTRPNWQRVDLDADFRAIATELHCNSVAIYGSDVDRLSAATSAAHRRGLGVVFQLRAIDADRRGWLRSVAAAAGEASRLSSGGKIILNIGCEISLFMRGLLPGRTFLTRMRALAVLWPLLPWINRRLNRALAEAVAAARRNFAGPITYSAGSWESIDWRPFDYAGINLYRDRHNISSYVADLRRELACGKPLLITEFGCCAFKGAELLGGGGWLAIDHFATPPVMKPGHERDEAVQAKVIAELLDIHAAEGATGAYVFEFLAESNPHHAEPARDLDMAGYGIVRIADADPAHWTRKAAYEVVAGKFARMERGGET